MKVYPGMERPRKPCRGSPAGVGAAVQATAAFAGAHPYVFGAVSDEVVLQKADGTEIKVPIAELSEEDLGYIRLQNPPKIDVEFFYKTDSWTVPSSDYLDNPAVTQQKIICGVDVKQLNNQSYNHELTVEYYAIGQQWLDQDKYYIIDRKEWSFVLSEENNHSFKKQGSWKKFPMEFTLESNHYGKRYVNNLAVVTDKRGEMLAWSGRKGLLSIKEQLDTLPLGAFFDIKTGKRVHPTGPIQDRY